MSKNNYSDYDDYIEHKHYNMLKIRAVISGQNN